MLLIKEFVLSLKEKYHNIDLFSDFQIAGK